MVAQDRFVMEAVSILTLLAETKILDAFVKQTLAQDRFCKDESELLNA